MMEDYGTLYDTWKFLYKVIVLANKSLDVINEKKDLLSVQQQQEYGAEVKAVRALFYYYAMDMFGRIPLILSSSEQASSGVDLGQVPRSAVFRFVFNELQQASPFLPDEHSNKEGNFYGVEC